MYAFSLRLLENPSISTCIQAIVNDYLETKHYVLPPSSPPLQGFTNVMLRPEARAMRTSTCEYLAAFLYGEVPQTEPLL